LPFLSAVFHSVDLNNRLRSTLSIWRDDIDFGMVSRVGRETSAMGLFEIVGVWKETRSETRGHILYANLFHLFDCEPNIKFQ